MSYPPKIEVEDIIFINNTFIDRNEQDEEDWPYPDDGTISYKGKRYYFKMYEEWWDGYNYFVYDTFEEEPIYCFSLDCDDYQEPTWRKPE
jgi:hypothetical protein